MHSSDILNHVRQQLCVSTASSLKHKHHAIFSVRGRGGDGGGGGGGGQTSSKIEGFLEFVIGPFVTLGRNGFCFSSLQCNKKTFLPFYITLYVVDV